MGLAEGFPCVNKRKYLKLAQNLFLLSFMNTRFKMIKFPFQILYKINKLKMDKSDLKKKKFERVKGCTLTFAYFVILHEFCRLRVCFLKLTFPKKHLPGIPSEFQSFVGPHMCTNSLKMLSANGTGRHNVKKTKKSD